MGDASFTSPSSDDDPAPHGDGSAPPDEPDPEDATAGDRDASDAAASEPTDRSGRREALDEAEEALARVESLAGIDAGDLDVSSDDASDDAPEERTSEERTSAVPASEADTASANAPAADAPSTDDLDDDAADALHGGVASGAADVDATASSESLHEDRDDSGSSASDDGGFWDGGGLRALVATVADRVPGVSLGTSSEENAAGDASGNASGDRVSGDQASGALPDQCDNCGALLDGPYCAQCGQKAENRIKPLWHMFNEAIEAVFELDLRVLKTLPKFLFLPGRLTEEYIGGRRRRYLRPFRLYLFATFFLFTTLTFLRPGNSPLSVLSPPAPPSPPPAAADSTIEREARRAAQSSLLPALMGTSDSRSLPVDTRALAESLPDTIRARFERGDSLQLDRFEAWLRQQARAPGRSTLPEPARLDSIFADSARFAEWRRQSAPEDEGMFGSAAERKRLAQSVRDSMDIRLNVTQDSATNAQVSRLLREKMARSIENPSDFLGALIDRMPYMMFLLLPVFALLLKLLYVRHGRLYMEHFIFTLHMHALAFFAFAAGAMMEEWGSPWVQEAGVWVLISPFLYLFLAMMRVYDQGVIKTFLKINVLLTLYFTVLSIGLILLAALTVFLF